MAIRFGTSGWRAVLGEEFTFANVRLVCQAIALHLREAAAWERGVVVGHDARFLGERFARAAAEVLVGNGIPSLVCERETPTPVIAFQILHRRLAVVVDPLYGTTRGYLDELLRRAGARLRELMEAGRALAEGSA